MNSKTVFDVLVVYSGSIALSANRPENIKLPFRQTKVRNHYNNAYAYFLESCEDLGLSAAFSTSSDIIDAGTCNSYWQYTKGSWKKVRKACFSKQIFDKFSPITHKKIRGRNLLFSADEVQPFNNEYLASLLSDKLETYKRYPNETIPTVVVDGTSQEAVNMAIKKLRSLLKEHRNTADFTKGIIVKDRFGSGGNNIYKVNSRFASTITEIVKRKNSLSFVLQPFVKFQNGYSYDEVTTATDIRLIYQNSKLVQTYIRRAKTDDFRCNAHQGGSSLYVKFKDVPKKVLVEAKKIATDLSFENSLFALDFIMSDLGNVYFLEGNIRPGIYWDLNSKIEERMSKKLISGITTEIALRISREKVESKKPELDIFTIFGAIKNI